MCATKVLKGASTGNIPFVNVNGRRTPYVVFIAERHARDAIEEALAVRIAGGRIFQRRHHARAAKAWPLPLMTAF